MVHLVWWFAVFKCGDSTSNAKLAEGYSPIAVPRIEFSPVKCCISKLLARREMSPWMLLEIQFFTNSNFFSPDLNVICSMALALGPSTFFPHRHHSPKCLVHWATILADLGMGQHHCTQNLDGLDIRFTTIYNDHGSIFNMLRLSIDSR